MISRFLTARAGYTAKYSFVHGFYWPIMCSSFGFGTVFFLSKHYTNSQVGAVLAVASILSVFSQPVAASFADSSRKIGMKRIVLILIASGVLLAALRFFFADAPVLPAVFYILENAAVNALQPLLNALGVEVMNNGGEINFGLSRGIGSICYAVVSFALGLFLKVGTVDVLPLFSIVFYVALGVAIARFPADRRAQTPPAAAEEKAKLGGGEFAKGGSLLRGNGLFALLLVATVCSFCGQSMIGSYLIQILQRVGGGAENVGIASGIAATIELPAMVLFTVLIRKIRSSTILRISFGFFVCKTLSMMLATSVGGVYATQLFQFGSYALFIPASVYYANEVIPESSLAKGQAALTSASTFGGVAASLLGGWLLDLAGVGTMLTVSVGISLMGCILGLLSVRTVPQKQPAEN
jgi:PPP family 3-phenylpropionic acid transporter